jgi:hypothetical protein
VTEVTNRDADEVTKCEAAEVTKHEVSEVTKCGNKPLLMFK